MDHRFFHRLWRLTAESHYLRHRRRRLRLSAFSGASLGTDMEAFRHSKYIIAWGANIHGTNIHFVGPLSKKLAATAPSWSLSILTRHATAALADWYLPINPGNRRPALALAMMHVIINENLFRRRLRLQVTRLGFDELKKKSFRSYPPEKVAGFNRNLGF